jgi:hypothetical protein
MPDEKYYKGRIRFYTSCDICGPVYSTNYFPSVMCSRSHYLHTADVYSYLSLKYINTPLFSLFNEEELKNLLAATWLRYVKDNHLTDVVRIIDLVNNIVNNNPDVSVTGNYLMEQINDEYFMSVFTRTFIPESVCPICQNRVIMYDNAVRFIMQKLGFDGVTELQKYLKDIYHTNQNVEAGVIPMLDRCDLG